ncbi:hypothetical protein IFM89_009746 [Coptis chinensis]|uniref:Uncharacterized protein n=1 Tax=Coptis chinensis TaxID=261450 RepID=A0A835LUW2_9MAGN|nr:hypothetical protein IFM89_009746 [Coptis chinensis]
MCIAYVHWELINRLEPSSSKPAMEPKVTKKTSATPWPSLPWSHAKFTRASIDWMGNHIDPLRTGYAQHNAAIYGVDGNIDFIKRDFFQLAPKMKADSLSVTSLGRT